MTCFRYLLSAVSYLLIVGTLQGQSAEVPLDSALAMLTLEIEDIGNAPDKAAVYRRAYRLLRESRDEGTPAQLGLANKLLARIHLYDRDAGNMDTILYYGNARLAAYLEADVKGEVAAAHSFLCNRYQKVGDYASSEPHCFTALELFEKARDTAKIAFIYSMISGLYRAEEDYVQAEEFAHRRLELGLARNDTPSIHTGYAYLAALAGDQDSVRKQLRYAEAAFKYIDEYSAASSVIRASRYSQRGDARLANGDDAGALTDFRAAWQIVRDNAPAPEYANGWVGDIGRVYHYQGRFAEAIPLLKDQIDYLANRPGAVSNLLPMREALADSYAQIGNLAATYQARTELDSIRQQLSQASIDALRTELRAKYDTEEKAAIIDEQEAWIEQRARTQRVTYGFLGMLGLGAVGLYFGLRNNRRKNALLTERNEQNELLLKEIHHRVKNNLDTVSSLLELQSATLPAGQALVAMKASQCRVQSMGLLHQRLYQGKELASIEMKAYFVELARALAETYDVEGRITLAIDVPPLELDIDTAVPVGLIVNELLTNAIKYAYPGGATGTVRVAMRKTGEAYWLTVGDDGPGKVVGAAARGTGFGSRLIDLLVRQLGGRYSEADSGGLLAVVEFAG